MSKTTVLKVTINNEALAKALEVKAGTTVDVTCRDGVPVDRYWRNRFKEAELDQSVSLPTPKPKKEASKPAAASSNQEA